MCFLVFRYSSSPFQTQIVLICSLLFKQSTSHKLVQLGSVDKPILLIKGLVLQDPCALCEGHDLIEGEELIHCQDILYKVVRLLRL